MKLKRIIALVVTIVIFAILFTKINRHELMANLRDTHFGWFSLALAMFIPQIGIIAYRWRRMVKLFTPISMGESVSLILASQTMNLVLPSKMGDLTKALFLKRSGALDLKRATSLVVFEKMLDVGSLALMMLAGVAIMFARHSGDATQRHAALVALAIGIPAVLVVLTAYFIPPGAIPGWQRMLGLLGRVPKLRKIKELLESGHEVVSTLQKRGGRSGFLAMLSLLIWVCHLVQIYFFFLSLDARPTIGQFVSMVPLAIFIGLIPVSIAGFGTRDAAMIAFFPQIAASRMLGVSLYVNLRYILPSIAGVPFLNRYLAMKS